MRQDRVVYEPRPLVSYRTTNIGFPERWVSSLAGALLATYGLSRRDRSGLGLAVVGSGLLWRGLTGHSELYRRLGIQQFAGAGSPANVVRGLGVHAERSILVRRPVHEVYERWRQFDGLPRFLDNARVVDEQVPWFLTWRSMPGEGLDHAGSAHFGRAPGGNGTEVTISVAYKPPAGAFGVMVTRLLGEEPATELTEHLSRFKRSIERRGADRPTARR